MGVLLLICRMLSSHNINPGPMGAMGSPFGPGPGFSKATGNKKIQKLKTTDVIDMQEMVGADLGCTVAVGSCRGVHLHGRDLGVHGSSGIM